MNVNVFYIIHSLQAGDANNDPQAAAARQQLSQWTSQSLTATIANIVATAVPGPETMTIDKLDLDLGTVAYNFDPGELTSRLSTVLLSAIESHRNATPK